ncbi:MAG: coenzyme F430 synthase [Candidatus Methanomethylophilaceae archaeon]
MYGDFRKQEGDSPEKVLIMDMVHGGDIIARRLLPLGYDVTCADVYGIAKQQLKDELTGLGARVSGPVPKDDYDLVISPAHCPDTFLEGSVFKERMTFSAAVGRLVGKGPFRIEVTGVKGKTSTCYLIAHILDACGRKVYLHTSRGDGPYVGGTHYVEELRSIAPTSILVLPDTDYDVVISEVSLGGSSKANISVITNLAEDYGIAKDSRKASCAKAEIFNTDGVNIVMGSERDVWSAYTDRLELHEDNIRKLNAPGLGEPLRIGYTYDGKEYETELDGSYLSLQYLQAMDMAMTVCSHLHVHPSSVSKALSSFRGVPGRGEISERDGTWYVTERNPGISHISVNRTMECLKEMGALGNAFVIVDPVSKKVCDKMKAHLIRHVLDLYETEYVFTDGVNNDVAIPEGKDTVIRFVKEGFQ